jgi:cell division transport system ATP-binding protein
VDRTGATIVQLERVVMRYGTAEAVLHDINLALTAGSFHFLVGPSGAGKTSLFRLLSLSHPPASGRVVLFGRDVSGLDGAAVSGLRRRVGIVFQESRLIEHLTAFDNVALPLRIRGAGVGQVSTPVSELLAWLGLGDVLERRPAELSTGQRQLVAVARAVIGRPSLLLADEPTSFIDTARARRLMELFRSLHRLGTAVVLATHSERLVREHPFPVLRIEAGHLTAGEPLPMTA